MVLAATAMEIGFCNRFKVNRFKLLTPEQYLIKLLLFSRRENINQRARDFYKIRISFFSFSDFSGYNKYISSTRNTIPKTSKSLFTYY